MGGSGSTEKVDAANREICKAALRGADETMFADDKLLATFRAYDTDNSGTISIDELTTVLQTLDMKWTDKEIKNMVKVLDLNKDSVIDASEFVAWLYKSPDLEKYFHEQNKITLAMQKEAQKLADKMAQAMAAAMEAAMSGKKAPSGAEKIGKQLQDMQEKYQRQYETKLTPLIRKAFAWHDKGQNGKLEKEESILFFAAYVSEFSKSMDQTIEASCVQSIKQMQKLMSGKEAKEMIGRLKESMKDMISTQIETYKGDIATKQRDAFAVIDVDKDGCLQEAEVVAALTPGTPKNIAFLQAIGLFVDPGKAMGVGMGAALGGEGGCPQQ